MKKKLSKICSLLLCFILCFGLLAGCGGDKSGSETEGKDEVVIATDTDLKALDPMKNWNSSCYYIYWTCYDRLVGYNEETGEFEPELAESWEISDDGMIYTFHLRDDVKWHDGSDFTAEDVKYTVERGIETGCGIYPSVSHATVVDPYTIEFHMLEPNSLLMDKQWNGDACIIQKDCGDDVAQNVMGTGAYKIKEWVTGDHLTIEANPDYWGEQPKVKTIKFVTMPEANTRLVSVQSGDVDAAPIPAANVKQASADENLTVLSKESTQVNYIGLNVNYEPLSNKLVRQAIAHALDKDSMIQAQLEGHGSVVNTMVPPMISGHDASIKGYEYDIEKAKDLLAEAGYADGFKLELSLVSGKHDLAAQVIQSSLKEIGIEVTLKPMDATAFNDYQNTNQAQMTIGYRSSSNADFYVKIMHSDNIEQGRNAVGYSDPEMDKLLDETYVAMGDERDAIYAEVQEKINDEAVVIPLYTSTVFAVVQKDLKGVDLLSTSGIDFSGIYY